MNTTQASLWTHETAGRCAESSRLTEWRPDQWPVTADWRALIDGFFSSEAGQALGDFVRDRLEAGAVVYPPQPLRALELTALSDVRVLILGQDPYHGPGQAQGLSFSVAEGVRLPPSLRNIFKELQRDLGVPSPANGSLLRWARQGVLLLNTTLTVEEGRPASHARRGWERLTDAVLTAVACADAPIVFMLWGNHAQAKEALINASPGRSRHLILRANHPSPLAATRPPLPFIGCGHFHQANAFLAANGCEPVNW